MWAVFWCSGDVLNIPVVSEPSQLRAEMSVEAFTATLKIAFMMKCETT